MVLGAWRGLWGTYVVANVDTAGERHATREREHEQQYEADRFHTSVTVMP